MLQFDLTDLVHPSQNYTRGNMWHHFWSRFFKIRLQILHLGILAHQTVDILQGLPEGSRLRPTLFGMMLPILSTNSEPNLLTRRYRDNSF